MNLLLGEWQTSLPTGRAQRWSQGTAAMGLLLWLLPDTGVVGKQRVTFRVNAARIGWLGHGYHG